ncbi:MULTISPECIES: serine hydrolase [Niastella]|uniref:Serine hydrolase n=1 Tax=Niastella soli TaxID=2821487 RepID=A0ABS3Z5K7_9BACT|nr:serine hydrolase [Niastella soli]MBO9205439.1 serine hydrolase [Niastella soli]
MQIVKALLCLFVFANHYFPAHAQINIENDIDRFLQTQFKPNETGGVVLVAKYGKVLYKKAFGLADLELNVPVNDSMIFQLASNTKQFTAVAILQLVENNRLQLEDTLGKFLAGVPCPFSSITIRQLLSHTSGLTEQNGGIVWNLIKGKSIDTSMVKALVPGVKWEYNNNNFAALGYILEKITGTSYGEYLKEHIFKPAGMTHSYMEEPKLVIKNRAHGYGWEKNANIRVGDLVNAGAAGGIQSNVDDMLKWTEALQANILLKPETLQLAFTPQQLKDGSFTDYGFGWYLQNLHGSPVWRHGGGSNNQTSETLYFPKERVYVIILTNTSNPAIQLRAKARVVAGIAINKPYAFDDQPTDKNKLKVYTGLYENEFGELVNIWAEGGKLLFQRPNGTRYKLGFAGNDEFFLNKDFYRVTFNNDGTGKITSLTFSKLDMNPLVWFKTQKPLLKLAQDRIPGNLLQTWSGKYFLPGADTVTITNEGVNLFYKENGKELLLAARDSTHFFALKEDLAITFTKYIPALTITKNSKSKQYVKL